MIIFHVIETATTTKMNNYQPTSYQFIKAEIIFSRNYSLYLPWRMAFIIIHSINRRIEVSNVVVVWDCSKQMLCCCAKNEFFPYQKI